ncbi:hypothetical protein ACNHKD_11110 [Methylocystis sp. JAN1]|uniref:hypothetical protein n=1 Tax=Methylocystis sp. JAN1 TaxID=3397211 RepID=UPI003FA29234
MRVYSSERRIQTDHKEKQHIELQSRHRASGGERRVRDAFACARASGSRANSARVDAMRKAIAQRVDRSFDALFFALDDAATGCAKACFAYASCGAT